ncbi:MAG: hypothetical protein R2762_25845 [Bryobacteraceae bacterium]
MGRIISNLALWAAIAAPVASAQPPGQVMVTNGELELLDSKASRKDFDCKIRRWSPSLGFDLRYHSFWVAELKPKELPERGGRYRLVVRARPEAGGDATHLTDSLRAPPRAQAKGKTVALSGGFVLGPGKYRVDWLLRDPAGGYCTSHWDVTVKADDNVRLAIEPNTVAPPWGTASRPAVAPGARQFHVKILANFSNTRQGRATLDRRDSSAVAAIVRAIAREPRFGTFSTVAFNMQEERVLYEAANAPRIDFRALGQAMATMRLGVVDFKKLADRNSATRFLTGLLTRHLSPPPSEATKPDCVIIVGPKFFLDRSVPKEAMAALEGSRAPVFYLNYVPRVRSMPWRDAVGAAVKTYGGYEFRITTPQELGKALEDILSKLDK